MLERYYRIIKVSIRRNITKTLVSLNDTFTIDNNKHIKNLSLFYTVRLESQNITSIFLRYD